MHSIDILFDGPPGAESGRFIEVHEAGTSRGVNIGEWIELDDGKWALRVDLTPSNSDGIPLGELAMSDNAMTITNPMDRDKLALNIMKGLIPIMYEEPTSLSLRLSLHRSEGIPATIAKRAYAVADAMIVNSSKPAGDQSDD